MILTGEEGRGKTTLLRQFAVKAAAGLHPFTDDEIEPVRVMFADFENSAAQTRREFRPLCISAGGRLGRGMLTPIIQPTGIDLLHRADVDWLLERLERNQPELAILGPSYKLAGGDPTSEEVARAVSVILDQIRADYHCAVILEAHSPYASSGGRRPLRPYGASLWNRWPEFGLSLSAQGQLTDWRGARDADRPWPTVLQRGGDWPWTVTTNPRAITFAQMVETVQNARRILPMRVLEERLGVPKSTIQRIIDANRKQWEELTEGLES